MNATTNHANGNANTSLVSVEGYNMGLPIDLVKLDGTWHLQYTSAPDVLKKFSSVPQYARSVLYCRETIISASHLPFPAIFFGVTSWLFAVLEQEGATLLVFAKFDIVSARNIYLQLEESIVHLSQHICRNKHHTDDGDLKITPASPKIDKKIIYIQLQNTKGFKQKA
ncbi:putative plastid-lipid-associated protein 10 [Quercus suber]|uniref:Plastid-lipid-associated protein 10 n=1 Tax=Quercus suber TaxID=58331 RepID=A0AAW0L5V4_QUESU